MWGNVISDISEIHKNSEIQKNSDSNEVIYK